MALAFLQRALARQLGDPRGRLGSFVVGKLNQRNLRAITEAVATLSPEQGSTVADIGYGGGVGLRLLMDAVGPTGTVHGVEPSTSMVVRTGKEMSAEVTEGRLVLHEATMSSLPFADGQLDGWISLNTIYFISDLAASFADLARVTAPSGHGVLGIADPAWLAAQPFAQHGFTVRPVADVTAQLESAGFTVSVRTMAREEQGSEYHLLTCTRQASSPA